MLTILSIGDRLAVLADQQINSDRFISPEEAATYPPHNQKLCLGGPRTGSHKLFAPQKHDRSLNIVILQCNDKPLGQLPDFEMLRQGYDRVDLYRQSAYLNAAYAALHGYAYRYHFDNQCGGGRHKTWCKLQALHAVMTSGSSPLPDAVLFLDSDAYIRTDYPLALDGLLDAGFHRALALDEGDETWPGIYNRIPTEDPPISRHTHLTDLQTRFENETYGWAAVMEHKDLLNTGLWLEMPGAVGWNLTFIETIWQMGASVEGGRYRVDPYHEQRIMNLLFIKSSYYRSKVSLLEDILYNSPRSPCVVHLYAEKKTLEPYRTRMADDLLSRLGMRLPIMINEITYSQDRQLA